MFTGIVQGKARLLERQSHTGYTTHIVQLPPALLDGVEEGASVANNGCCLTVTAIEGDKLRFDLVEATLKLTNLADVPIGGEINIERAARFGDEIGGHLMSGHIMAMADVSEHCEVGDTLQMWFELPAGLEKYLFNKGFIGIDGISLTIAEIDGKRFCVNLIPETLQRTVIAQREVGDKVNIEIDPQTQAIVDTVERMAIEGRLRG